MTALDRKLAGNEVLLGLFCCTYSVQVVEALAGSGYDFLIFDAEHTPGSLPHLHAQLLALGGTGTAAIVRVPGLDPAAFKLYAGLGVDGIMLPNVGDAATAARACTGSSRPARCPAASTARTSASASREVTTRSAPSHSAATRSDPGSATHSFTSALVSR